MGSDNDTRDEFTDAELDRLSTVYNGRDADGRAAGIGIQARDRLIRKLIEEVRAGRARAATSQDRDGVERAIVGALRDTIHAHGAITAEWIGSAVKRIVGNLRNVGDAESPPGMLGPDAAPDRAHES
jgi:hypothetical protein